jgi:hypothetical protein
MRHVTPSLSLWSACRLLLATLKTLKALGSWYHEVHDWHNAMERSWFHMHARASPADRPPAFRKEGRGHAPHGRQTRFSYTTCRLQCCTTSCRPCAGDSLGGPPRCVELALARPLLRVVCRNTCGPAQHHHVLPGWREEGSRDRPGISFPRLCRDVHIGVKRKKLASLHRPTVSTSLEHLADAIANPPELCRHVGAPADAITNPPELCPLPDCVLLGFSMGFRSNLERRGQSFSGSIWGGCWDVWLMDSFLVFQTKTNTDWIGLTKGDRGST